MTQILPIFAATYRYFWRSMQGAAAAITSRAALLLQFDFSDPKSASEFDFTDPKGASNFDFTDPKSAYEFNFVDPKSSTIYDFGDPKSALEFDFNQIEKVT